MIFLYFGRVDRREIIEKMLFEFIYKNEKREKNVLRIESDEMGKRNEMVL